MDDRTRQLEQAYREIGPHVRSYLRRRVRNHEDADELLQETFIAAAKDIEALHAAASKRAWLIGIARNLVLNHFRRSSQRRIATMPVEEMTSETRREDTRIEQMREQIRQLPAGQREVLELRLVSDLSYAEIAEAMGIPIGTVRSRLHHAIRRLKDWAERTQTAGAPRRRSAGSRTGGT